MLTVGEFIQFSLEYSPSRKPLRRALCNFTQSFGPEIQDEFCADRVLRFINHCTQRNFWQKNNGAFAEELKEIFGWLQTRGYPQLTQKYAEEVTGRQLLRLINEEDVLDALNRSAPNRSSTYKGSQNQFILVQRGSNQEVKASTHNSLFAIQDGQLSPLAPMDELIYDNSFRLKTDVTQSLYLGEKTWARFCVSRNYGGVFEGLGFDSINSFHEDRSLADVIKLRIQDLEQYYKFQKRQSIRPNRSPRV